MPREPDRPTRHEPPHRGVPPQDQAPDPRREGGVRGVRRETQGESRSFRDRTPTPETEDQTEDESAMIREGVSPEPLRRRDGGMIGDA